MDIRIDDETLKVLKRLFDKLSINDMKLRGLTRTEADLIIAFRRKLNEAE